MIKRNILSSVIMAGALTAAVLLNGCSAGYQPVRQETGSKRIERKKLPVFWSAKRDPGYKGICTNLSDCG